MSMTNLECLATEIIDPLRYPEDFSTQDSIGFYNDLLTEIIKRLEEVIHIKPEDSTDTKGKLSDIINELNEGREAIREIREDLGLCPNCGERLQTKEHKESRGEFLGVNAYETMYTDYCPECGWSEDND